MMETPPLGRLGGANNCELLKITTNQHETRYSFHRR